MTFDTTIARGEADWFLEYPDELDKRTKRFAMMMRAACNEIDKLKDENAKLRAVADAANRLSDNIHEFDAITDNCFMERLDDALAALDVKGTP